MQSSLVGKHPFLPEGLLLVEGALVEKMRTFRQDSPGKLEGGGILLGYRRGPHLHLADATTPSSEDRRARTSFHRAAKYHQEVALTRWSESGGVLDYLGEWHTHPESEPNPSLLDLEQWRIIHDLKNQAPMTFIILGDRGIDWYGIGHRGRLLQVTLEPVV